MGNIEINQRSFYGSVSHTSEFGGHKWQEHGPFHNHKSANFDRKTGSILEGGSSQNKLHISAGEGSRRATANPSWFEFRKPTGARDHYSYGISGSIVTVRVIEVDKVRDFLPENLKNDIDSGEIYKQEYKNKQALEQEISHLINQGVVKLPLANVTQQEFNYLLQKAIDNWQTEELKAEKRPNSLTLNDNFSSENTIEYIEKNKEIIENILLSEKNNLVAENKNDFNPSLKSKNKTKNAEFQILDPIPMRSSMIMDVGVGGWRISSPRVGGKNNAKVEKSSKKSSAIPHPEKIPVTTKNGENLYYQSHGKHTGGQSSGGKKAGIEPRNSDELFANSVPSGEARYTQDSKGNIHRFFEHEKDVWHWSGSTSDKKAPLKLDNGVKSDLRKKGMKGKILK